MFDAGDLADFVDVETFGEEFNVSGTSVSAIWQAPSQESLEMSGNPPAILVPTADLPGGLAPLDTVTRVATSDVYSIAKILPDGSGKMSIITLDEADA